MDEARDVLARLGRIETLERRGAAAAPLLHELRELAREAAVWAEHEADPRARRAAEALATAIGPYLHGPHEARLPCPLASGPRPSDSAPHPARR